MGGVGNIVLRRHAGTGARVALQIRFRSAALDPQHSILVSADLPVARLPGHQAAAMQRRILDAVEELPGVERLETDNPISNS
jgi:hypothetical protein